MSKKIFRSVFRISIILIIAVFFSVSNVRAEEIIDKYLVKITVNEDATINVEETIDYDFGEQQRRGIYREIPIKYDASHGKRRSLRLTDLKVLADGEKVNYKKTKKGSLVKIRIGKENKFITGKHSYQINYKIDGALNYFDGYTELYWNAIGLGWPVKIKSTLVKIKAPSIQDYDCFAGVYGDLQHCIENNKTDREVSLDFGHLQPGEGATIVLGINNEDIAKPFFLKKWLWFLFDNWVLFLPIGALGWMGRRWWRYGRDPEGRGTIIPYYDVPDNLSVGESSVILHNQLRTKDVSAMIIQLAVKGYIKIKQDTVGKIFKKTRYTFSKSNDYEKKHHKLTSEEKYLFKSLFGFGTNDTVNSDDLKDKFYKSVLIIQQKTKDIIKSKGYLPQGKKYNGMLPSAIAIIQMIIMGVLAKFFGGLFVISGLITMVILIFFAAIMGHRTKQGVEVKEKLLGLKLYLEVAEKDRIKFHNAPAKNPKRFEKLLPYAMLFGVEKEWAEQFKDIYKQQPDWYQGANGQTFNAVTLANSVSAFSENNSSGVLASPSSASSGGSGFSGGGSGGGFGGGGGGSW